jgi:hypothetical protein
MQLAALALSDLDTRGNGLFSVDELGVLQKQRQSLNRRVHLSGIFQFLDNCAPHRCRHRQWKVCGNRDSYDALLPEIYCDFVTAVDLLIVTKGG